MTLSSWASRHMASSRDQVILASLSWAVLTPALPAKLPSLRHGGGREELTDMLPSAGGGSRTHRPGETLWA